MTKKFESVEEMDNFESDPAPVKAIYCDHCKCIVKSNELMVDNIGRFTHTCGDSISFKTKEEIDKLVEKQKE